MRAVRLSVLVSSLVVGTLALPNIAHAQYTKGQKFLGAHVGIGAVGSGTAIGVQGEMFQSERVAFGVALDRWSYGEDLGVYDWDVSYTALAGTGTYHFKLENNPKLVPFLGAAIGYFVVSTSSSVSGGSYTGDASRIFFGGFGGTRYFFSDRLAGVARLGFGASSLTLGVDFKM